MKRLIMITGKSPVPNARLNPSGSSWRYLIPKTKSTPIKPNSAPEAPAEGPSVVLRMKRATGPTEAPALTTVK